MEDKRCHLQFLQDVITRMASNSFLVKGWSITLVAALFALALDKSNLALIVVAVFPCAFFWLLDGYFLWQEQLYRALYDKVRVIDPQSIDYSMNTGDVMHQTGALLNALLSQTLVIFHGGVLASIFLVMLVLGTHSWT